MDVGTDDEIEYVVTKKYSNVTMVVLEPSLALVFFEESSNLGSVKKIGKHGHFLS